ncbi:hypothetical protein F3J23_18650 [Chryseobacterium sp. Tr-659]|uniref:hypothetical protein n=1 Tax=Chryseobacterium sp. Tr-659 TaxID=2608340 RepID=UPI001422283F|nr:hypothetical protein [Chryseobacterium sp. Tr-659]NIF07444.1 hypothetical protein [Chryseobacterium sp. Tr-659]
MKKTILMAAACLFFLWSCKENGKQAKDLSDADQTQTAGPKKNPYLSNDIYGVTHINPAQTDCVPYKINDGEYDVDLMKMEPVWGGPVNIFTFFSTQKDFMWSVSTDRIALVDKSGDQWKKITDIDLPGARRLSVDQLKSISDVAYPSVSFAADHLKKVIGAEPGSIMPAGVYSLVSSENYVYTNAGNIVSAVGMIDEKDPSKGLEVKYKFDVSNLIPASEAIPGVKKISLVGMNMTYDGHIIIGAVNGIAVIDREFKTAGVFYPFGENELCSNSMSVDDGNGIYIATGSKTPNGDGIMRKLVWTGKRISDKEEDGAWKAAYPGGEWPPAIKAGTGTGSTPTLMGFDDKEDQLVLITDGQNRMNLIAFWRNKIPDSFQQKEGTKSRRIAGSIPITAGLPKDQPWIQSEQSVVANKWGAFVVNNLINEGNPDKIIDAMTVGPVHPGPKGMERLEWNPEKHEFTSVWTRNDVVSTSMVPVVTSGSNIVLINGYTKEKGWQVTGLDWNTGKDRLHVNFGFTNRGNGAYANLQLLEGDLLFNSVIGPYRIPLRK